MPSISAIPAIRDMLLHGAGHWVHA